MRRLLVQHSSEKSDYLKPIINTDMSVLLFLCGFVNPIPFPETARFRLCLLLTISVGSALKMDPPSLQVGPIGLKS
jgi:hypothetical protein